MRYKSSPQRGEEAIQSEQKRTLGVQVRGEVNSHTVEQHLQSAECWLKTQAVCKSFQPNVDTFNANVVIGKRSIPFHCTNNAILRGLNNCSPQNDCKNSCRSTRGEVRKTTRKVAFTLAEVLITLGIIGIIAALTLPTFIQNYQDRQFKIAYKKAYSDISQAFQEGIVEGKFNRTVHWDGNSWLEEMNLLKEKFKIALDCPTNKGTKENACWKKGDTVCGGSCKTGNSEDGIDYEDGVPYPSSNCFVDGAGRSWCSFDNSENMFLVDTNGFAKPNRFGKDRFMFTFADKNGKRTFNASSYAKVIPYASDTTTATWTCKHPPCYYKSWLYN